MRLFYFVAVAVLYFVPTIIAESKGKRNKNAVLMLNILLGWTFVGWVVALVWSLTEDAPPATPAAPKQ